MLTTMKEILDHASSHSYGVAAPNVNTELDARAALEAAEELQAPVILDIATDANPDIVFFGKILVAMAQRARVPVALNLDHGANMAHLTMGIQAGFTSTMADRSHLSFEENVRQVAQVVEIAHSCGISVEAELGQVGQASRYEKERDIALTDPQKAAEFLQLTQADCLAVAIGNAHGAYAGHQPYLDFDRLMQIKEATKAPLVLHGGSGTGDAQLQKACKMGINKVNISNDLLRQVCSALQTEDFSGNRAYNVWEVAKQAYKVRLKELMQIFGGAGKAWHTLPVGYPAKPIVLREF